MLTLPWLVIMLIHGPNFWIWVATPGCLYLIEKILRYRKSRSLKHGETFIMEAIILPSQVRDCFLRIHSHRFLPRFFIWLLINQENLSINQEIISTLIFQLSQVSNGIHSV